MDVMTAADTLARSRRLDFAVGLFVLTATYSTALLAVRMLVL